MVLNGQHFHAVRQNQPLKSQLFPEKACDHPPGHGAGQPIGLQGGKEHVAHHNGRNALGNGPAEGDQLQRFQFLLGLVHAGKPQVAVHCRVSVARKMLGAAQNAAAPVGGKGGAAKGGHSLRVIPKAAHADDRIAGVGVHVQHRGHIEVGTQSLELPDGDLGSQTGIFRIARCGQGHGSGHIDCVLWQTADHAALLVDDDEGGIAGLLLNQCPDLITQPPQLVGGFHIAQEENNVADFVFSNQSLKFRGQAGPVKAEYQLLPQHFSLCHGFHSFG